MVDRQIGDAFRLCKAHIHGRPVATIISGLERHVVSYTAAIRAEMKVYSPSIGSAIRRGVSRCLDVVVDVAIRPENTIAATNGAIACGDRFRRRLKQPTHTAAVTCPSHPARPPSVASPTRSIQPQRQQYGPYAPIGRPADQPPGGRSSHQRYDFCRYRPSTDFTDPALLNDQSIGLFSIRNIIEFSGSKPMTRSRWRTSLYSASF
jgi:hypothetical protein